MVHCSHLQDSAISWFIHHIHEDELCANCSLGCAKLSPFLKNYFPQKLVGSVRHKLAYKSKSFFIYDTSSQIEHFSLTKTEILFYLQIKPIIYILLQKRLYEDTFMFIHLIVCI